VVRNSIFFWILQLEEAQEKSKSNVDLILSNGKALKEQIEKVKE
jgi:hypothetical protein